MVIDDGVFSSGILKKEAIFIAAHLLSTSLPLRQTDALHFFKLI
jgi:hypothetical protein